MEQLQQLDALFNQRLAEQVEAQRATTTAEVRAHAEAILGMTISDLTVEKVLMGEIENGVDVKDESLYEITREGGYGKAKTTTILKKLDIEVATKRWRRLTGRTVIDYTVGTAKKDLEALIASTKNSTTMCIHKTSGMWKADDWTNEIYINRLDSEKLTLVIYVTHPAPTMSKNYYEEWQNGEYAIQRKKILFWLDSQKKGKEGEEKPYTLRITDMPYDISNEL